MSESFKLEIWICIVTLTYILGFLQIYGVYKFKSIYGLLIVQKRYPQLVLIETIASLIELFIGVPLWVHSMFEATETHSGIDTLETVIEYSGFMVITYAAHFIGNIEAVRLWLMCYDLNYLHSSVNEVWKSEIDTSFSEKDWYLKQRSTFGSKPYVARRVFIYYLCAATLGSIALISTNAANFGYIGQCIDATLMGTPVAFTLYIYYKCPKKLNDNFLFHYEFKTSAIIFSTGYVVYFTAWIIYFCGFPLINIIIMALDCVWAGSVPSLLSTIWIPQKILRKHEWTVDADHQIRTHTYSVTDSTRVKSQHKVSVVEKLLQLLQNAQSFESFVKWMYREFSSETILCFIELVQFKQLAKQSIAAHKEEDKGRTSHVISDRKTRQYVFYESVPKSSIVYMNHAEISETNCAQHFKNIAHLLFEKYIKIYGELEVNISSGLRSAHYALDDKNYEQLDASQISTMFDDVVEEMFKFMMQSFIRYHQDAKSNLLHSGR
eukprot:773438_1